MQTTKGHLAQLPECKKPDLPLTIWPDECLKYAVRPFPEEHLGSIVTRNAAGGMIRSMYKHHGVGLAAPQAAIPFQIFVMDAYWTKPDKSKNPRVFLNPVITEVGKYATSLPHPGEGCLSFPYDFHGIVQRHDQVELQWLDFKGDVHHEWFGGYESIIVQHEMDHLTGHCFIDRLSQLKQGMGYRRARKMRRRYYSGMKEGLKMFKKMQKSPEALLARNQHFEAERRKMLAAEDAADLALIKERLESLDGTISLEELEAKLFIKTMENPPKPNKALRRAAKRYREAIENGTLEIKETSGGEDDIPSGDSEGADPRHSSRFTAASRRLVQRESARRDRKRMQLSGDGEGQEGDGRTETDGVSK